MAKPKRPRLGFDPRTEFLLHPHDKYAKFILKMRSVAISISKRYLPQDVLDVIDLDTIALSSDSFVDEYLHEHFSDVCYSVMSKTNEKMKLTILIEHKSTTNQGSVMFQLNRYIGNIVLEHEKRRDGDGSLPLVVPIVLHHGDSKIKYETPHTLYPYAPASLLQFVPSLRYILINTQQVSDPEIETIEDPLLQKFLFVLKYSRNEGFIAENWNKLLIFAVEDQDIIFFNRVTIIYLNATSSTYREKLKNMDTLLPSQEAVTIKSYLFDLYDEGMEKGLEKGMEKGIEKVVEAYMRKYPTFSDNEVAETLEVSLTLVRNIRKHLAKK